jgi:hypothetical protein
MSFQLISDLFKLAEQYPQYRHDIKKLIVKVWDDIDDDEMGQGAKLTPNRPMPEDGTKLEPIGSILKFTSRHSKLHPVKSD